LENKKISLVDSILLMTVIVALMVYCVLGGVGLQVPLLLSWFIVYLYTQIRKTDYGRIEKVAMDSVRSGLQSVMILLTVGALIAAWISSGTVQTLIYYGLLMINPRFFLVTALIFCSIISLATGTSYGTVGSGGLAMMGVGMGLGVPPAVTAGAVISGAYFGDKMSPFSDTTNLAPAMAGANLFDHIRHMIYTTGPAYLISMVIYTFLGFKYAGESFDATDLNEILMVLRDSFNINVLMLIPVIIVIILLLKRTPAVPTMLLGTLLGVVFAVMFQGTPLVDTMKTLWSGYQSSSDLEFIDKLLNRGGISSMGGLAMVTIFAMGLGGMLEELGVLSTILNTFVNKITTTGRLVLSTIITSYIASLIGCTQSFAHVITGRTFKPLYDEMDLEPINLSRAMEDSGTIIAPLIPWHTNAMFMAGVLGVATIDYAPYVVFSWITPIISIIYGYTGYSMIKRKKEEDIN